MIDYGSMDEREAPTPPTTKYLLFTGDHYYPGGGWSDFSGIYDSIEEAQTQQRCGGDWAQIVNTSTLEVVCTALGSKREKFKWGPIE